MQGHAGSLRARMSWRWQPRKRESRRVPLDEPAWPAPTVPVAMDYEGDDDEIQHPTQFTDWCCLPEDELLSAESKGHLDEAVRCLPEKLQVVFLLRDIEGLSIRETSETLGLTETAVKTRLLRARLNLREQLSTYYGERLKKEQA